MPGEAIGAVLFIEDVTGVTIGKRKRGFTITGAFGTGVSLNEDHAATDRLRLEGNHLVANGDSGWAAGMLLQDNGGAVIKNALVGNRGPGLALTGLPAPTITKNSIFGSRTDGATNCGIDNGTGATVDAPKNFWGAVRCRQPSVAATWQSASTPKASKRWKSGCVPGAGRQAR